MDQHDLDQVGEFPTWIARILFPLVRAAVAVADRLTGRR